MCVIALITYKVYPLFVYDIISVIHCLKLELAVVNFRNQIPSHLIHINFPHSATTMRCRQSSMHPYHQRTFQFNSTIHIIRPCMEVIAMKILPYHRRTIPLMQQHRPMPQSIITDACSTNVKREPQWRCHQRHHHHHPYRIRCLIVHEILTHRKRKWKSHALCSKYVIRRPM